MKYGKYFEFSKKQNNGFGQKLAWVARAVYPDEIRPFMQFINVDEKYIVATDGKRIYILEHDCTFLEPGKYQVILKQQYKIGIAEIFIDGDFPKWQKVVPDEPPIFTTSFEYHYVMKSDSFDGIEYSKLINSFPEKTMININLVYDLMPNIEYEVEYHGNNNGIVFKADDMKAVIMPLQV